MAAVRVKSEAAQATQALMRIRERRIRQRVQTTNQLRGLLSEFGIVLPKGQAVLLARLGEVMASAPFAALPALVQELVERLREEIIEQADKVKAAEAMLIQAVKADASSRLLMSIPNIGPINAAALSVALEAPGVFARGRAFAAYLRLVPRQQASAESRALHGIGQMRACEMRSYLVLAAQTLLIRVNRMKQPPQDRLLAPVQARGRLWASRLLRRKMRNVAVVAVAAKLARIAWAVMAHNQPYRPRSVGAQPV